MLNYLKKYKNGRPSISQILMLVALTAPIPSQVSAGMGQIFANYHVSAEDLRLIMSTAKSMYDLDKPKVGSHSSWINTNSGASGIVTITHIDGRCVGIRHNVTLPKTSPEKQVYYTRRCKDNNGSWHLEAPN